MTVSEILRDASQLDVAVHRSVTESKLARKDPKTSSTGTKSTFNFPHILEVMFYQYQPPKYPCRVSEHVKRKREHLQRSPFDASATAQYRSRQSIPKIPQRERKENSDTHAQFGGGDIC